MVLNNDIKTIEELFSSENFLDNYNNKYKNKSKSQLILFLDNIETNKKYYKLGIGKKKFKRVDNSDTSSIKEINSLINKITDDNYNININKIIPLLKTHFLTYIIENILEKSLMHHIYIHVYVRLIYDINKTYDIQVVLNKEINKFYKDLINNQVNGDTYQDLCKKNNNIDKLCGLSLLIVELEKNITIENNSEKIIKDLLDKINYDDLEYIYKILLCIQKIFSVNSTLINEYRNELNEIKDNKINSKIKFKIMDILDI